MTSEQRLHIKGMNVFKKITIETKPHKEILNNQVGDYQENENEIIITVADIGNKKLSFLIAIHELVELFMINDSDITIKQVEDWDAMYEYQRKDGDFSEAGDHPKCPYRRFHFAATNVERIVADLLNVSWSDYENKINSLEY